MGKIVSTSGNNDEGVKSVFYKKKIIIIKGEIPPQKDREKDDDRQKASWKSSESFFTNGQKRR